jgi:hypothetical protein
MIQGWVVVLKNRQVFKGRSASYSDYNRVTKALWQPGSAMKAIVYLAAFQHGGFTLETLVPDEPISVPDGGARPLKWISNYDGRLKVCSRSVRRSPSPETPLERYPTTALGASEMNLLELANAVPHDGLGHRRRAVRDPGNRARFGRDSRRRPTRTIADLY